MMRIHAWKVTIGLAASLLAMPAWSQTQIAAPSGWTTQTKAGGGVTFVPPDLAVGENYSTTIYDSAPLNGKTLEEYLRAFAGTVSKTPGHLASPLKIETREGRLVTGVGVYDGPQGTQ